MNIFKNVLDFWKQTWQESKTLFFLEMFGAGSSILGASLLTFLAPDAPLMIVFPLYIIGSVLLLITSYIRQNAWLMCLMAIYIFVTVIGLGRLF